MKFARWEVKCFLKLLIVSEVFFREPLQTLFALMISTLTSDTLVVYKSFVLSVTVEGTVQI